METRWIFFLVLSSAGIATFFPLAKIVGDVDPYVVALMRSSFAALTLFPIVIYFRAIRLPEKGEWPLVIFLAFCTALPTIFLTAGIAHTNSVLGAILMNTQPLMIGLVSPLLIGEHVNARKVVAITVGFVGVLLVVLNGRGVDIAYDGVYLTGVFLILFGACIAALNKMYSRDLIRRHDGLYVVFLTTAVGSFILFLGLPFASDVSELTALEEHEWLVGFLIGTVSSAIPWSIWSSSLKHLDVHVAVSFNLLIPVFAAVYAVLFLGEIVTSWVIAGLFLTSVGVYFVQRESKPTPVHTS